MVIWNIWWDIPCYKFWKGSTTSFGNVHLLFNRRYSNSAVIHSFVDIPTFTVGPVFHSKWRYVSYGRNVQQYLEGESTSQTCASYDSSCFHFSISSDITRVVVSWRTQKALPKLEAHIPFLSERVLDLGHPVAHKKYIIQGFTKQRRRMYYYREWVPETWLGIY